MLFRFASLGAMALLIFASAVAARSLTPVAIGDQDIAWESGVPFAVSRLSSTTVAISPIEVERERAWIVITIINCSRQPITVHDGGITASGPSGAHLRVLGYEELAKREKRRRFWENVGLGLAAAANGYSAGQSAHTRSDTHHSG